MVAGISLPEDTSWHIPPGIRHSLFACKVMPPGIWLIEKGSMQNNGWESHKVNSWRCLRPWIPLKGTF